MQTNSFKKYFAHAERHTKLFYCLKAHEPVNEHMKIKLTLWLSMSDRKIDGKDDEYITLDNVYRMVKYILVANSVTSYAFMSLADCDLTSLSRMPL